MEEVSLEYFFPVDISITQPLNLWLREHSEWGRKTTRARGPGHWLGDWETALKKFQKYVCINRMNISQDSIGRRAAGRRRIRVPQGKLPGRLSKPTWSALNTWRYKQH